MYTFKFGMVGVGKNYSALITEASRDCNLSEKKVKVNYSLYVYILCFYFTYKATHKKISFSDPVWGAASTFFIS